MIKATTKATALESVATTKVKVDLSKLSIKETIAHGLAVLKKGKTKAIRPTI